MPDLTIERVPVDSIEPHPQNPREGDVGAISESLRQFGQYRPIVVQRSTRRVLAGNHTLLAARSLHWPSIDAVFVDVDDDEAVRILLIDNRSADLGSYNDSALGALLTDLSQQTELGLSGTGYDGDDLDRLLADLNLRQHQPSTEPPDPRPGHNDYRCPECGHEWEGSPKPVRP